MREDRFIVERRKKRAFQIFVPVGHVVRRSFVLHRSQSGESCHVLRHLQRRVKVVMVIYMPPYNQSIFPFMVGFVASCPKHFSRFTAILYVSIDDVSGVHLGHGSRKLNFDSLARHRPPVHPIALVSSFSMQVTSKGQPLYHVCHPSR